MYCLCKVIFETRNCMDLMLGLLSGKRMDQNIEPLENSSRFIYQIPKCFLFFDSIANAPTAKKIYKSICA